ncbi:putative adhesin [Lentzea sp. E54]|uniref:putative adhesin n=1 Tax=Lentzea xerophila TaxID=3435883 RepID=UPI003DA403FB
MVGVVIGHGSHEGKERVTVPAGLTLHFFADEDTRLATVNVLELIKKDHHRTPMHVANAGTPVPNYKYEPYKAHELRAIAALYECDAPVLIAGSKETPGTLRLCANPGGCPETGPHACDGLFGRAAREQWKLLLIVSCRVDTTREPEPEPTLDIMTKDGRRDRRVHDELVTWVQKFVGTNTARQDEIWNALPAKERLRLAASDDEVWEWDECRAARATPGALASASDLVKVRLMRDYPEHRAAARAGLHPEGDDATKIAEFLPKSFNDRADTWAALEVEDQARWMLNDGVVHWAAGYNAFQMFRIGLPDELLLGLLRRLEPPSLAVATSTVGLSEHLAENSLQV